MARFIQPQQQQIVPMYTPQNIDFYANILNKAQGDLERATAMKAAALEKYGDLTAYTQEDRDLTWGTANKDLANVLDADFVSPSRVASAVMETNKKVMPYVQALKAKDKEAQLQRQLRAQWGTDFIGNDVANMAIADAYGQAVDPSSIRGINYNAEQFRKMFHESYGANLLNKVESALKSSGRAGILTRETVKGLTKQTKDALLSPGSPEAIRLASQNFTSLPEDTQKDLAAIYGGVEGAINYLQQENYKTAFDPRYNYESSFQDITDPQWVELQRRKAVKSEEEAARRARIQTSVNTAPEYLARAQELSNMSQALLGKNTTGDNLIGRASGWLSRNIPGFKYTLGIVDRGLELVGGNLYTNPDEFRTLVQEEYLPTLIKDNSELYKSSTKEFSGSPELKRAYGIEDKSSPEDIKNAANAYFLESLAMEEQSKAGTAQALLTYAPNEIPNVVPDALAWVSNGNEVLDLGTGKNKKISDFEKFEQNFRDASIHFNPSENRIELTSNIDESKVAIPISKLDETTNQFTSFASKVVKLSSGKDVVSTTPRTIVLPDGKPTVAYIKVKRVGNSYLESYIDPYTGKPILKDGKEVVNVTNPNVYVEEAQMAFEDTYLKK